MSHRLLWNIVLWSLLAMLLFVLCAPLLARAESGLDMFVSPRVTELREVGDEYVVWAAIKTPGAHDRIEFDMDIDPRVELYGAMPTYGGPERGGGACYFLDDNRVKLHCYAIATKDGWVGITVNLRLAADRSTYAGRELTHTVTVGELSRVVTVFIPEGELVQTPQVWFPTVLQGGE